MKNRLEQLYFSDRRVSRRAVLRGITSGSAASAFIAACRGSEQPQKKIEQRSADNKEFFPRFADLIERFINTQTDHKFWDETVRRLRDNTDREMEEFATGDRENTVEKFALYYPPQYTRRTQHLEPSVSIDTTIGVPGVRDQFHQTVYVYSDGGVRPVLTNDPATNENNRGTNIYRPISVELMKDVAPRIFLESDELKQLPWEVISHYIPNGAGGYRAISIGITRGYNTKDVPEKERTTFFDNGRAYHLFRA